MITYEMRYRGKAVITMVLNRESGYALLLIVCGALMVLDQVGLGLGHLLSYIFHSVAPVAPIAPVAPLAPLAP
jgi:hypothetical protein